MTKCIRVFLIVMSVFFIPNFVFAQDADAGAPDGGADAGTLTPVGACFAACERLAASLPEDDDTDGNALMARCETELPECSALDSTVREALPSFCDRVVGHHGHGALPYETTPPAPEPPPAFCVLPTGTDADTGRHRCGCPAGTYPLRVSRERSADRLRSLHVPAGHAVFVCYNPLAAPGTPGSGDERFAAVERAVTDTTAALERLCEPHEGESLPDACARAADRWNTIGSTAGPVDLDPIMHAIEGLQHNAEAQQAVIDHLVDDSRALQTATLGNSDAIEGVSRRLDALSRCLSEGGPQEFDIYTEYLQENGTLEREVTHVHCPELLAAASHQAIEQAREAARSAARDTVHEMGGSTHTVDGGHAFAMLQAYGLVGFNPLTYGNVSYGNVWQLGGELTVGVGLGSGWNFHGGLGVAYGGPNIQGATNVAGEMRIGVGTFVIPELMIGFGFMATHRFLPDVFSADSIYGAYLDGTIRFMPNSEWSPVLTLRVAGGASPREAGRGWDVQPNGLAQILFGVAHF